ncbi:MAG: hypothetical protein JJ909_01460 [Roseivirga sp.]|nr:hypothetical protein [Roseivirga sp.]
MKKDRDHIWGTIGVTTFSIFLISWGVYLLVSEKYARGYDYYLQQETASGGGYYILIGVILGVITYLTLSPFGKTRRFFDRWRQNK